jgi:hypothetical protein
MMAGPAQRMPEPHAGVVGPVLGEDRPLGLPGRRMRSEERGG